MNLIVPAVTATPAGLALLADKLSSAIFVLQSWRVRVPPAGRLIAAKRMLERVAAADCFPPSEAERSRLANAIRISFDFYHIAQALPEDRVYDVAEDLRRAQGGTLDDAGPTEAHRAQSQLLIAAAMAAGGLKPGAPRSATTPTPDYVARVGTLRFAVEVKRPESLNALRAKIDEAIDQIAAVDAEGGAIVVDLSDCMTLNLDAANPETEARSAFRELWEVARQAIIRSTKPGRHKITNLFVFANLYGWQHVTSSPTSALLTYEAVLHDARAGLLVEQSRDFREKMIRGFQALGAQILDRKRVP